MAYSVGLCIGRPLLWTTTVFVGFFDETLSVSGTIIQTMGKWTLDYTGDVLHSKISSLVSGAIRRASVEKEPFITYDDFVKDLDAGDSFTTSLVEILVKELADRRTRNNASDRRLISDRTVRNLRTLASAQRVYSNRTIGRSHTRHSVNLTDYLSAQPGELEMEDDDDLMDTPIDMAGFESTRNAELFDYPLNVWSNSRRLPAASSAPSATAGWVDPPSWDVPPPAPATSGSVSVSNSANVNPRATARRNVRARMMEYSDAARRRAIFRDLARDPTEPSAAEPRDPSTWTRGTTSRPSSFFFGRGRRRETSRLPDSSASTDDDAVYHQSPPSGWYVDGLPTSQSPPPDVETLDDLLLRAPRLRRGGLRPPEVIASYGRSSPDSLEAVVRYPPTILSRPPVVIHAPENSGVSVPLLQARNSTSPTEEPVAYPTPGGSENGH